jgi:hypothetical protein
MTGKHFVDNCINSAIITDPWSHQIIKNSLTNDSFIKLENICKKFTAPINDLVHYHPKQFKDNNIDWYDEMHDIGTTILKNAKKLCSGYKDNRWYNNIGVNGHISITPPLPYKFYIHQEGIDKIWSSVTYITPEKNVGTKMYTAQQENTFIKEAEWIPNNTFIFCGKQGKTWHSYESNQTTNRVTLNFFIMKDNKNTFLTMKDIT